MEPLIEGMKELEVAELSFSLHVADILEPGAEIDFDLAGFLDFTQRLDDGIVELADVIHGDAAAKGSLDLVGKAEPSRC